MRRLRGGDFIADRDFRSLCEDHSPLAPSQWTGLGHGHWRLRSRWRLDGVLGCAGAAARDDAAKLGRRVARVSGLAEKPGRKFREFPSRGRVPGQRRLVQAPCGIASNLQRKRRPLPALSALGGRGEGRRSCQESPSNASKTTTAASVSKHILAGNTKWNG